MKTTLNEHDFKLIKICKSSDTVKYDTIRDYYCERCAMDPQYFDLSFINQLLLEIIELSGQFNFSMVVNLMYDLQPCNDWKFSEKPQEDDEYFSRYFSRLVSIVRMTEVVKLPGYAEWLDNYNKKLSDLAIAS